ncbi:hypothetical protein L1887_28927 [Cichorium endivia]|nr:hypothetical protein L1887_28927 [Cichorium endivia]
MISSTPGQDYLRKWIYNLFSMQKETLFYLEKYILLQQCPPNTNNGWHFRQFANSRCRFVFVYHMTIHGSVPLIFTSSEMCPCRASGVV